CRKQGAGESPGRPQPWALWRGGGASVHVHDFSGRTRIFPRMPSRSGGHSGTLAQASVAQCLAFLHGPEKLSSQSSQSLVRASVLDVVGIVLIQRVSGSTARDLPAADDHLTTPRSRRWHEEVLDR